MPEAMSSSSSSSSAAPGAKRERESGSPSGNAAKRAKLEPGAGATAATRPKLVKRLVEKVPSKVKPGYLWCDKYRPLYLDEMSLHGEFSKTMLDATKSKEFPHLLLYGPNG